MCDPMTVIGVTHLTITGKSVPTVYFIKVKKEKTSQLYFRGYVL